MIGLSLNLWSGALFGGSSGPPRVMRSVNTRARIPRAMGGATNWRQGVRFRFVAQTSFSRLGVKCPTFTNVNLVNQDVTYPVDFQCAFTLTPQDALTGLAARTPFTFSGVNSAGGTPSEIGHYDNVTGPFASCDSDIYELGQEYPKGTVVEIWCSMEASAHTSQGSSKLYNSAWIGSSLYTPNYERTLIGSTSFSDISWAKSATDVSAGSAGPTEAYMPFVVADCGPDTPCVGIFGDSLTDTVTEGSFGSGTKGDFGGGASRVTGWADRYLVAQGIPSANFSKASMTIQNMASASGINSLRMQALVAKLGITEAWFELGTNDIFARTIALMTGNYVTLRDNIINAAGLSGPEKVVPVTLLPKATCAVPITTLTSAGTTATAITTLPHGLVDGQIAKITGTTQSGYNKSSGVVVTVLDANTFTYPVTAGLVTPATGSPVSNNGWISPTGVGQAPFSGFGPSSKGNDWNVLIRTLSASFGHTNYIDPQIIVQAGAIDSFLYAGDGVHPEWATGDGIHPPSDGHEAIAAGLPAYPPYAP